MGLTRLALTIAADRLAKLGDLDSDAYKIARQTLDESSVEDIFIAKEIRDSFLGGKNETS